MVRRTRRGAPAPRSRGCARHAGRRALPVPRARRRGQRGGPDGVRARGRADPHRRTPVCGPCDVHGRSGGHAPAVARAGRARGRRAGARPRRRRAGPRDPGAPGGRPVPGRRGGRRRRAARYAGPRGARPARGSARGAPPPAPGWRRAGARGPARGERTRPGRAAARSRRAGHRARRGPPARPGRKLRRGGRPPRGARRRPPDARGGGRRDAHHGGRQASGVPAPGGAADSRGSTVVTEQLRMWLAARAPRERMLLAAVATIAVLAGVLTAALAIHADLASLEARVTSGERELAALRRLAADLGPTPTPAPAGSPPLVARLRAPARARGGPPPRGAQAPTPAPPPEGLREGRGALGRAGPSRAELGRLRQGLGGAAPPIEIARLELRKHPDDPRHFDATIEAARIVPAGQP